ncbi:hypothetical protein EYF80_001685 [Liparis tanakae]|uniref:Uncharacterized protein n=1 Tax=Liparis tanakae TaxID=230148 RepID=A0A4Z2JE36_9TELE|nr:hypothetical protein EYF80_001685 [Liparis tanakae]
MEIQSHPVLRVVRANVRAGAGALSRLQLSRRWRCCCVGWPADEIQDLRGRDFRLGSSLQLDTETARRHPHFPLLSAAGGCGPIPLQKLLPALVGVLLRRPPATAATAAASSSTAAASTSLHCMLGVG